MSQTTTTTTTTQSLFTTTSNGELSSTVALGSLLSRPIEWIVGNAHAIPEDLRLNAMPKSTWQSQGLGSEGVETGAVRRHALVWRAKGYSKMAPYLLGTRPSLVMHTTMRVALDMAKMAIDEGAASHRRALANFLRKGRRRPARGSIKHDLYKSDMRRALEATPAAVARREARRYFVAMRQAMSMVVDFWKEVEHRSLQTLAEDKRQVFLDGFEAAQGELAEHWPTQDEEWQVKALSGQGAGVQGPSDFGLLWTSEHDVMARQSTAGDGGTDVLVEDVEVLRVGAEWSAQMPLVTVELASSRTTSTTTVSSDATSELVGPMEDTVDGIGEWLVRVVVTREFDSCFGHLYDEDGSATTSTNGTPKQWLFIQQSLQRAKVVHRLCETTLAALSMVKRDMDALIHAC